jgi:hypothetical protein
MVKGALIGAVGGAMMGLMIGGDLKGAAIGAAAGALAGAGAGYWQARQQQANDKATLYNSVFDDVSREAVKVDETQLALNQLLNCRKRQASEIREAYRRRKIDAVGARTQMASLREKVGQDVEMARKIKENIDDRSSQLEYAIYQVNPEAQQRINNRVSHATGRPGRAKLPSKPSTMSESEAKKAVEEPTVRMLAGRQQIDNDVAQLAAASQGKGDFSDAGFV